MRGGSTLALLAPALLPQGKRFCRGGPTTLMPRRLFLGISLLRPRKLLLPDHPQLLKAQGRGLRRTHLWVQVAFATETKSRFKASLPCMDEWTQHGRKLCHELLLTEESMQVDASMDLLPMAALLAEILPSTVSQEHRARLLALDETKAPTKALGRASHASAPPEELRHSQTRESCLRHLLKTSPAKCSQRHWGPNWPRKRPTG